MAERDEGEERTFDPVDERATSLEPSAEPSLDARLELAKDRALGAHRDDPSVADEVGEAVGGISGVLMGAGIGSAAGPIGTLIGGVAGAIGGWWSGRAIAEAAETLSEEDEVYYRTHFSDRRRRPRVPAVGAAPDAPDRLDTADTPDTPAAAAPPATAAPATAPVIAGDREVPLPIAEAVDVAGTTRAADASEYEDARPAYYLGHIAAHNPDYEGRSFDEIEPELERGWRLGGRRCGDWATVREYAAEGYRRCADRRAHERPTPDRRGG